MPRLTQSNIHSDFSTGSGVWTGYRAEITGFYNDYGRVDLDDHLVREYNKKINDLNISTGLLITPVDAGYRYIGDGSNF